MSQYSSISQDSIMLGLNARLLPIVLLLPLFEASGLSGSSFCTKQDELEIKPKVGKVKFHDISWDTSAIQGFVRFATALWIGTYRARAGCVFERVHDVGVA